MAAPDEPAHAIAAAAAVRGQIDVRDQPEPLGPEELVRVPAWTASTKTLFACFVFSAEPASCSPKLNSGTESVPAYTQYAHNIPLYYLLVGVPSLVSTGATALYAMRMVGTLVNSSLIALGLFLVTRYRPQRALFAGVLVALSPMVFFITSVLNSSGMEIAAAFAAWCGGLCLIEYRPVPPALAGWTALAFGVLVLSRPASPANAAAIILTLGTMAGWSRCKDLARDGGTLVLRLSLVAVLIVAGLQVALVGLPPVLGVPVRPRLSFWGSIWLTSRLTESRLRQAIGNFGWLDVPVPEGVFAVWSAVVAGLVGAGMYVSARCRRAIPVLALCIVAMPLILESPNLDTTGLLWQGRYWLPLLVGVPLVAMSHFASRDRVSPRSTAALMSLGLVLIAGQIWAFVVALHRYENGVGGTGKKFGQWAPPGGAGLVTGAFVVGMMLYLGFIVFVASQEQLALPDTQRRPRRISRIRLAG